MAVLGGVLALVAGLLVGGLLTTAVARVPDKRSLTRPPAQCDACRAPIAVRDQIPVASWLLLQGRCRHCSASIPPDYPLVEAATGLLFLVTWAWLGASWELPAYLYFAALAVACTAIDIRHHRLPDFLVLPSYPITLALLLVATAGPGDVWDLGRAVLGGAALFAFFFLLAFINPAGMGGGDIKLAGVLGMLLAWFGWWPVVVGGMSAFFLGAILGLVLILTRRGGRKTDIPFGPFMFAGAYIGLWWGTAIGNWYLR